MDWIRKIDNLKDILDGDPKDIAECCGVEVLISLWENFPKMSLYISTGSIKKAQRQYVRKFFNGVNAREIARELNVSERFIYKVAAGEELEDENATQTMDLFGEKRA